ncbi:MAG: outer membrane lipoprotein-sorting protein [Pyrinomonadaceae bacterium]
MKRVKSHIRRLDLRLLLFTLVISLSLACGGATGSIVDENGTAKPVVDRGEEIVAEHVKREAVPFRKDRIRFTIREEGEKTQVIELDAWRRHQDDTTTTISVIAKPAEDAGLGTMTIEEKGQPTVVVSYAVSRDEFRETDSGKMFFGGLTAQELLGEWNKYSYKFISDASGLNVDGKLKTGEKSVIDATKLIFDPKSFLPVEMHLFDNTGKEMRVFRSSDLKTVNGHSYFARTDVVNHVYKSEITIEILNRDYPEKLDDVLFTRERLKESAKK